MFVKTLQIERIQRARFFCDGANRRGGETLKFEGIAKASVNLPQLLKKKFKWRANIKI